MKLKRIYKNKNMPWLLNTLLATHKIICHGEPTTKSFQHACFQFDNIIVEFLLREDMLLKLLKG